MVKTIFVMLLWSLACFSLAAPTPIYQIVGVQSAENQTPFIKVPLNRDIYSFSASANLSDLVVLDNEGNFLPYRIMPGGNEVAPVDNKIVATSVAFFAVPADATPETLRKLHTESVSASQEQIKIATSDRTLNNKTPEFYLIDISQLEQNITSLAIAWEAQAGNEYVEVEVEATRNLQDWNSLAQATLVQIHQGEQSLKRNHVDLNIAKNTYSFLRLRILRGGDNLHINQVTAEEKLGSPPASQTDAEHWTITGQPAKDQHSVYAPGSARKSIPVAAWEFKRGEATPAETLAIDFGNNVYAGEARIFSRTSENQPWRLRQQGIWFNAQVGNKWQTSDAISLHRETEIYWRIELNESAQHSLNPSLRFAWHPDVLQIIGNNKAPFSLAINPENTAGAYRDQVFNQITAATKPNWMPARLESLHVDPASLVRKKSVEWTQWLFWGALVLAVALLLLFALKLFKQMTPDAKQE